MLAPLWQFGHVRLPFKPNTLGKIMSLKLIKEVTHYPASTTTDLVMSQWFFAFNLSRLHHGLHTPSVQKRPSWVKNARLFQVG
jgi:hypothetical protein